MYQTHPALSQKDFHPDGFEWINCSRSADNIVSFLRKTGKPEETLLFICNFAPVEHEQFQIGVPFYGKFKEILNSDAQIYGGSGKGNPRVKTSKQEEWDDRENSLVIDLPPMCTLVFSCTPTPAPKKVEKEAGKKAAAKGEMAEVKKNTRKKTKAEESKKAETAQTKITEKASSRPKKGRSPKREQTTE